MSHIHSNWNNNYAEKIVSTDCYSGCTGITHCDDIDLGVNEYINGLDEVPIAWGGYEFTKDSTFIIKINLTSSNKQINLAALLSNGIVDWGDGNITTGETVHVYDNTGIYVIKGNYMPTAGVSFANSNLREAAIEVYQIANNFENKLFRNLFREFRALTYVNMNGFNRNCTNKSETSEAFVNCTSLKKVDAYNCGFYSDISLYNFFNNCYNLSEINGTETWDISKVNKLDNFVYKCSKLSSFYAPKNINVSLSDFTASTLLTAEHLMSIINNLDTVSVTQTLKIGATNLAKLTPEEIKIATDKGWTVL